MNDKELADRVVALGVGKANQIYPDGIGKFYQVDVDADWQTSVNESKFVRDWRVAGSLMERCEDRIEMWEMMQSGWHVGFPDELNTGYSNVVSNESLPRAIISACCEALTNE